MMRPGEQISVWPSLNFFAHLPLQKRARFSVRVLYWITLFWLLVWSMVMGVKFFARQALMEQSQMLASDIQLRSAEILSLGTGYGVLETQLLDAKWESLLMQLTDTVHQRHFHRALAARRAYPFGQYLQALADRSLPQVWLTQMVFSPTEIQLTGNALSSDAITRYLQGLLHDPLFAQRSLSVIHITQDSTPYQFVIETPKRERATG